MKQDKMRKNKSFRTVFITLLIFNLLFFSQIAGASLKGGVGLVTPAIVIVGWVAAANEGVQGFTLKAVCSSSPELCEAYQWIVSPGSKMKSQVFSGIGEALGVDSSSLQNILSGNPEEILVDKAMNEFYSKAPGLKELYDVALEIERISKTKNWNIQKDNNGRTIRAEFEVGDDIGNIGKVVGKDLNPEDIKIKNARVLKQEGSDKLTIIIEEEGYLEINGKEFKNLKKDSFFILTEDGEIYSAAFETKGGKYILGNQKLDLPSGTRVLYKDGIINLEVPPGSVFNSIPTKDDFNKEAAKVKLRINSNDIGKKDYKIKLKGNTFSGGVITFAEGQVLVEKNDFAILNNVEITNKNSGSEYTCIFFNVKHSQNSFCRSDFINFDINKRMIQISSPKNRAGRIVRFYKDNPFVKIENTDYFAVQTMPSSSMIIQNRDIKNKIPLVTIKGNFKMDEDHKSLYSKEPGIVLLHPRNSKLGVGGDTSTTTTTPLELRFSEGDVKSFKENILGKDLDLSKGTGKRIVIGNDQEFGVCSKKECEGFNFGQALFLNSDDNIKRTLSTEIKYNYMTPDIFEKLTKIKVISSDQMEISSDYLKRIYDYLQELSPAFVDAINEIHLLTQEELNNLCNAKSRKFSIEACAFGYSLGFNSKRKPSFSVFIHEANHAFQASKSEDLITSFEKELKERLDEASHLIEGKPFLNVQRKAVIENGHIAYPTGTNRLFGAENGCLNPYFCLGKLEEMGSVAVEKIKNPSFWKNLIVKENKNNLYYRIILAVTLKHERMSQEDFNLILKTSGLTKEEFYNHNILKQIISEKTNLENSHNIRETDDSE